MHSSENKKIEFSFIIPALNEELLLPELLREISNPVLKQKFNYEIIVSDGGSLDNTVEIAKKFADRIVQNKRGNQNISIGRNQGALIASGKLLIFLNADVRIANVEDFFLFLKKFYSNEKFIAATCKVKIHPEEETLADKIFMGFYNVYFHFLNIIGIGMGRGECQIIRKDYFFKVNGYNENLPAGEDFDLFRRLIKLGNIYFSRKTLIYESPRRYRKFGHLKILLTWTLNGLFVILKNKSLSRKWEQVR